MVCARTRLKSFVAVVAAISAGTIATVQLTDTGASAQDGNAGRQQGSGYTLETLFTRDMTFAREGAQGDKAWEKIQEQVGKPAPDFEVGQWQSHSDMAGGPIKSMRGEIVLIDFWGTWCPPCKANMPKSTKIAKEYAKKGVRVVGVCNTRGSDSMMETAKEHDGMFAMAADVDDKTRKAYGVQWWPYYVVVDRDGIVRAAGLKHDQVEVVIKRLLEIQPPEEG